MVGNRNDTREVGTEIADIKRKSGDAVALQFELESISHAIRDC